ncbi:MAG: UvrD-helicase domain-containing protein [Dysgonamonadaceae bacterium]|jgi:DNA helicase-2/ATP-dependent DNA helicase PcrA|nr:UvrD-helicase domain-containing protein [Dysgonamonadaceae bacterium]
MDQFLGELNESQREAVLYNDGPSLVVAGAGSGKTRVLTYKIAYLLKNGISPYNILSLTFTNKAAREMKDRIARIMGDDIAWRLWMGTFHSIFSKILRREADKIGFKSDFTIYDSQDSKNLIKAIIKEMALDDKIYKPALIHSRISRMKNALITPESYAANKELIEDDFRSKRPATRDIYTTYRNRCRTSGVMDFDDLLLNTWLLFREFPDVIARYRNQFRFILVDEYQDTNSVQHEIVNQLAADHHRICVVGDDAQSIYSFRGANISNILDFRKIYPESKLFKLEQNYRSTQIIVNAANSLIDKNQEQIRKTVFSKKQIGEKIQVISAYSDYEEGYAIAGRIAEIRMLNHYNYSNFAILYRTNAQSRIFEEALRKRNMPYKIYGGLSFFQRKEVKDVIAYFRLISNPDDEEAFKRIINYPARSIGDTTVSKIAVCAHGNRLSLWDVISDPLAYNLAISNGTANKLKDFRQLIESFIEANTTMNAYEIGELVIRQTGMVGELYQDKTPEGLSRIQNIEELVNSLHEFVVNRQEEGVESVKMGDFLAEISLMTDQDTDKDGSNDRITMMTVHSAKGLEFKNVFVVGLEEDLFPSQLSKNSNREIEEERRLFYVAITRAEDNCILSYAKSRFQNGQLRMSAPSRFIKDIDRKYLKLPSDITFGQFAPENFHRFETPHHTSFERPWEYKQEVAPVSTPPTSEQLTRIDRSTTTQQTGNTSSPQNINGLAVGNTIEHDRFGIGEIVGLEGNNENAKATVEFENAGKKQLLLKFAKFRIIDN